MCSIKSINIVKRKNGLEYLKGSKCLSVKRAEAAGLFIRISEAAVILQSDISFDLYLFCLRWVISWLSILFTVFYGDNLFLNSETQIYWMFYK